MIMLPSFKVLFLVSLFENYSSYSTIGGGLTKEFYRVNPPDIGIYVWDGG